MNPINAITKARDQLLDVTPLARDCGELCGAACCQCDEDGQGFVHLFPGEDALYADVPWASVRQDALGPMLICGGSCPREMRPLGCRIFPLTPRRKTDGTLSVRIDRRAFAMCPLARYGARGLDPRFVSAATRSLRALDETPEGRAFIERWIALEQTYRELSL